MKQIILPVGSGSAPQRRAPSPRGRKRPPPRRRRRAGRQTLNYLLLLLIAAAIIMTLSMTVFFHIEQIEVEGATRYSAQQLIGASGVQKGDNLFRINEKSVSKKLINQFFYIEDVLLRRVFPAKLVIEITQEEPLGACSTPSGYMIVGKTGRVLEMNALTVPEGLMVVNGMYLHEPEPGRQLGTGYSKEQEGEAELERDAFDMLTLLVKAVSETGFDDITFVDFSDRLNILIVYEDRIIIELGVQQNLEFKLEFVENLIRNELEEEFEGILDASLAYSSKKIWRKPCDIEVELEKRQLTAISVPVQQEGEESTSLPSDAPSDMPSDMPANPNLEVKPGPPTFPGAKDASSGESSSSQEADQSGSVASSEGLNSSGAVRSSVNSASSSGSSENADKIEESSNVEEIPQTPGGYKPGDLAVKEGPPARPTASSGNQGTENE